MLEARTVQPSAHRIHSGSTFHRWCVYIHILPTNRNVCTLSTPIVLKTVRKEKVKDSRKFEEPLYGHTRATSGARTNNVIVARGRCSCPKGKIKFHNPPLNKHETNPHVVEEGFHSTAEDSADAPRGVPFERQHPFSYGTGGLNVHGFVTFGAPGMLGVFGPK